MSNRALAWRRGIFLAVIAAAVAAPLANTKAQTTEPAPPAEKWDAFVEQFLGEYFALQPNDAVHAGKHEFDGRIADLSKAGMQRYAEWLKDQHEKVVAFDAAGLDERRRFDREDLLAQIDKKRYWLEESDRPYTNPSFYGGGLDPDVYISREYAPLEVRMKAFTQYARNVPGALENAKANLRLPMARTMIKIGRRAIGGLVGFYAKDVAAAFAPVKDEELQREFAAATETAARAVRAFDAWLASQESTATDQFALGPEKFARMLKMSEGVEIPLDQLEAIGRRDLERNLAALKEACAKFAPGKSVAEAMALAATHKPKDPDPVVAASHQLDALRKFVTDHDVVTIPGTEKAMVRQSPAYRAWNLAYISIPGPYEKDLPSFYYVSPPDPAWPKAVQDAYLPSESGLLFVSAHEVYPGHFVQFLHANRAPSKLGRLFGSYSYSEGWAHYCEEMMYDAGLGGGDPETHIGQLQMALLRNARFLSALGLHTHGMSVEQSKQLFLDDAFQDKGNAEQQAERGTFDPEYLSYTMGKLMIRKLRDDWTATRGGRSAWKQFHDEFLKYGAAPIPMIRRAMMGAKDTGSLF